MTADKLRADAKLTPAQVRYVRVNPHKLSQLMLAEELAVSQRVISLIVRGITYKGVK